MCSSDLDELTRTGRDARALLNDLHESAQACRGLSSDDLMAMALNHPLTDVLPMNLEDRA